MAMGYGRGKRSVPAARMEGNMQIYVNAKARCDGDGTKERQTDVRRKKDE